MNRKVLNYVIFFAVVAVVVGLAVRHSLHMSGLVADMAGDDRARRVAAAQELVKGEQFMDAITGESIGRRVRIVQALEDWGTKEAMAQLVTYQKDPDRPVRDRIVLSLVRLATKSDDHLQAVVNGIKDGDANIRRGSVLTLQVVGRRSAEPAREHLARNLPNTRPELIDSAVQQVNFQMGGKLIAMVADVIKKDAGGRDSGGDVLGALTDRKEEALDAILPLLKDSDDGVKMAAASALGKIGHPRAVPDLILAMKKDSANVRRVAIGAIALIGDVSGEEALTEAIGNPNDDNDARAQAANGLGRIATPSAVRTLIKALSDDDTKVQVAAVSALGRAGRVALPALSTLVNSPDSALRVRAVRALAATGLQEAASALVVALGSPDAVTRREAADALGDLRATAGVPALARALADADGAVAAAAADALARIGEPARPALLAALSGPPPVAYLASRALGRHGQGAVPAIANVARQQPAAARWTVLALADIGGPQAAAVLRELASSQDTSTRQGAEIALKRLGVR